MIWFQLMKIFFVCLSVVASANGEPVSAAVVNVTVTDANDNAPTFPKSSYRLVLASNTSL